jgi:hypothetical protein
MEMERHSIAEEEEEEHRACRTDVDMRPQGATGGRIARITGVEES